MTKYEMKEIWNSKQVEIILWNEQRDRGRKEISEERRREVEESDNDRTYKEMISNSLKYRKEINQKVLICKMFNFFLNIINLL